MPSAGSGGETIYSWTVWHSQLLVDGRAFWVHSAELVGEDTQDIALTLGVPDQQSIGLDVLNSHGVVNLPWLGVLGLPLSLNQDGHVCFQAQVPHSPQAPPFAWDMPARGDSAAEGERGDGRRPLLPPERKSLWNGREVEEEPRHQS